MESPQVTRREFTASATSAALAVGFAADHRLVEAAEGDTDVRGKTSPLLTVFLPSLLSRAVPKGELTGYEFFKAELLAEFCEDDLVLDREPDGKLSGHGDAAWRTGLAAICMILDRDEPNAKKFLVALRDKCWTGGLPRRHPTKRAGEFTRDQFIPQFAACYLAHQLPRDESFNETRLIARDIVDRFQNHLDKNDWILGKNPGGWITLPLQWLVRSVTRKVLGGSKLRYSLSGLDDEVKVGVKFAVEKAIEKHSESWKRKVSDEIARVKIAGKPLPRNIRESIAEAVVNLAIKVLGGSSYALTDADDFVRLDGVPDWIGGLGGVLPGGKDPIEELKSKIRSIFEGLLDDIMLTVFSAYVLHVAESIRGNDDPNDYYSIHLLFWAILLAYECTGRDKLDSVDLTDHTFSLYQATKRHSTAPFFWLVGGTEGRSECKEWLSEWPQKWHGTAYVWQRSLKQQEKNYGYVGPRKGPRLDYMVLAKLFDSLDAPR